VTKRAPKDIAASVRQRLQNNARETGRPFQEVLQYFAMERFLYRLSRSPHAERFVLKGALMLTVWNAPDSRPTRDIDLLARMENTVEAILPVIRDVCGQEVEADGLLFDAGSIAGAVIKEDADYEGVRVTFRAYLQNSWVPMQIDMGFGDVVVPAPTVMVYPTILDHPAPKLRAYSRETAVAEKFEAMVKLGQLNSRMKDFYDIWLLSRQFDFDGPTLAIAVSRTFAHRKTALTENPVALTAVFAEDPTKVAQWRGFLKKSRLEHAPAELKEVTDALGAFLVPVAAALGQGLAFGQRWSAPGPWEGLRE
jgi:predicted nucleotidyltransferase component of viral defense system